MSLKAKLEAVIYAAEEPVTMAQLAALFASDALEWKAWKVEQEASASAAQVAQDDFAAAQPLSLVNKVFAALKSEPAPPEPASVSTDAQVELSPEAAAEAELEARRQARLRDREVREILRPLLDELIASCASDNRGVEIREVAGGFRMATKPEYHDAVRLFVKSIKQPLKLSLPALETLAVIAYKQPVTAPEVNEIRGVDTSAVFGTLLARKLITTAGRKAVLGRPILYKTTREFLLRFGLRDVSELPSMEEFEKLAALEFEEQEQAAGEVSEKSANPELSLEFDEAASEELEDPEVENTSPAGTAAGN
ncbi:MAG: SMC-Scp complex subunit ScpB [Terracidiphilus sp.]|jgi:segregation and condensation protein B